jgi:hypothetical protein
VGDGGGLGQGLTHRGLGASECPFQRYAGAALQPAQALLGLSTRLLGLGPERLKLPLQRLNLAFQRAHA